MKRSLIQLVSYPLMGQEKPQDDQAYDHLGTL